MKLDEKRHILLSRKYNAQLEDHIAEFIQQYNKSIYNFLLGYDIKNSFKFELGIDDDNDKYIILNNFIPTYLNTYSWLENNYKIIIYQNNNTSAVSGSCSFDENLDFINGKMHNVHIYLELNLFDFDINDLSGVIHHELLHVYESYNKIKNKKFKNYKHYDEYQSDSGDIHLNNIAQTLYLVSSEERHARLQNFYHEIKDKNYKDSETYNYYVYNYEIVNWINKNYKNIDIDKFLFYFGDFVEEVCKIKKQRSFKYFQRISEFIKKWTDDVIKRMENINSYINESQSNRQLENYILEKRALNRMRFDKNIKNRYID